MRSLSGPPGRSLGKTLYPLARPRTHRGRGSLRNPGRGRARGARRSAGPAGPRGQQYPFFAASFTVPLFGFSLHLTAPSAWTFQLRALP